VSKSSRHGAKHRGAACSYVLLLCCIGLVDAHTHAVWAGDRVHEFAMKVCTTLRRHTSASIHTTRSVNVTPTRRPFSRFQSIRRVVSFIHSISFSHSSVQRLSLVQSANPYSALAVIIGATAAEKLEGTSRGVVGAAPLSFLPLVSPYSPPTFHPFPSLYSSFLHSLNSARRSGEAL